jgi:hypothetical protein
MRSKSAQTRRPAPPTTSSRWAAPPPLLVSERIAQYTILRLACPAGVEEPVPVDKGGQVRRPLREAAHQRDHGQPEGNTAWCHALLSSHGAWAIEECQWPSPLWPSAKESRRMGRSERHVLVLLWHWYCLLKCLWLWKLFCLLLLPESSCLRLQG